jgi:hypothetical protein
MNAKPLNIAKIKRIAMPFPCCVIAGLDPAIHGAAARWMSGSRPGMTAEESVKNSVRGGLTPPSFVSFAPLW